MASESNSSQTPRADLLICPLCASPLSKNDKQLGCQHNHCFDIAKQGYVNLLPVQQKRSKTPGDDKAMVLARQQFLNAGYYQPLADKIASLLKAHITGNKTRGINLLDAGSGEGYYSDQIFEYLSNAGIENLLMYGIDISKPAVIEACKRSKQISWLVSSLRSIPLKDQSLDAIISVFSPIQAAEFAKKLSANGYLAVVTPGDKHLLSLKEKLYDEVKPFDENKPISLLESDWALIEKQKLSYELNLENQQQIQSLLTMTPHTWRISPERKARLNDLNELCCEADFLITLWQKKHHE